jgi:hypothetical protein
MKLFLLLAVAAVALFIGTSHADPRGWMPCHLRFKPVRCALSTDASNPPAVKDVNRVIAAAYRDHLEVTLAHLYATVNRAHKAHKGTRKWAFLIEEGVPGLAQRVGELADTARPRVAVVEVETPAGRRFRAVALRGLGLQSLLFGAFAHDIAAKEPTSKAFNRWGTRLNALHRWYTAQLQSVLAVTASKDRAAVEVALLRY